MKYKIKTLLLSQFITHLASFWKVDKFSTNTEIRHLGERKH
jgi:hypothetical protein